MAYEVKVTATGMLKEYLPGETSVPAGQTVGQAVETLQLRTTEAVIAVVNGRVVAWDHQLETGDRLQLIMATGGG